jgi:paraquat-inducible protein B
MKEIARLVDTTLPELSQEYDQMIVKIGDNYPEISRATGNFCKQQSRFMDDMLTVSHFTPIRNLRQILAEIQQTKLALGEAYFNIEKKRLDIKEKRKQVSFAQDTDTERLQLEIRELEWQISNTMDYVKGAIRKMDNYIDQYNSILESHGLQEFTEEDFEAEEERYHIAKAFEQGLNAARSHAGFIDEGNQIYFSQIGINGTVAQVEVANYLNAEAAMLSKGIEPTHDMQLEFFDKMCKKFAGCSKKYAEFKGMLL